MYCRNTGTNYIEVTLWMTNCTILLSAACKTTVVPTDLKFYQKVRIVSKIEQVLRITVEKKTFRFTAYSVSAHITSKCITPTMPRTSTENKTVGLPERENEIVNNDGNIFFVFFAIIFILWPTRRRRARTADDGVRTEVAS